MARGNFTSIELAHDILKETDYLLEEMELPFTELKGTARACGEQYGEYFEQRLLGFLNQETFPTPALIALASRCWKYVEREAPKAASFIRGIAAGAHLKRDWVMLLALHEEIVHTRHCTALAATHDATRGHATIIGQNWDWKPAMYPWAGLLRTAIKGSPRVLAYHYPGLWNSAGINEHGLSLMWTGAGYYPALKPRPGIPTYVLIAEILRQKNTVEALSYLQSTEHAGCFIFFLADRGGNIAVVEGIPGRIAIDRGATVLVRANQYECATIVEASKQKMPAKATTNSAWRAKHIHAWAKKNYGRIDAAAAKKILTIDNEIYRYGLKSMTIDSMVAVCNERIFSVSRGGRQTTGWNDYEV